MPEYEEDNEIARKMDDSYIPDQETIWDYVIQRMNELESELMILKEIANALGIPDGK